MITKKFSIIVPIYNVESYLTECIESVLSQTFQDYEVILINDGSTDGSLRICEYFASLYNNITIINKENEGVSSARNAGINIAIGEYIIFLDGDDFWNDNKTLEVIYNIAIDKNSDIISWGFKYLYRNDKYFMFTDANLYHYDKFYGNKDNFLFPSIKSGHYTIAAWDKAVRRELILKNQLYFKPLNRLQDMEWSVRVAICADNFAMYNIPHYVYRLRDDSVSHKFSYKNLEDAKTAFDISYNLIQKVTGNDLKNSLLMLIAGMYFTIVCDIRYPLNEDKYVVLFKQYKELLDYVQVSEATVLSRSIELFGFYLTLRIVRFIKRAKKFLKWH